ncbi:hypothetical protein BpHYR1_012684 [Brachionus plicatilis]|uniref:Uncharacterized protein n=1 Tax=Brachionus plicatilis TaxID=10195 RepID=A0A3M7PE47_BRAPC|nr:hypothetical protein BpHYR1_012684 [Brachionus plicatilis]
MISFCLSKLEANFNFQIIFILYVFCKLFDTISYLIFDITGKDIRNTFFFKIRISCLKKSNEFKH